MAELRIAMAQLNPLVGDVPGNADMVIEAARSARERGADAILFPELMLCGYPPEDLLLRPGLELRVLHGLERIKRAVRGIDVIVGYPRRATGGLYNAASLLRDGRVIATYHKQHLPNYSVFDEKRYFKPGSASCVVEIKEVPVALVICEDVWLPQPLQQAREAGARLVLVLNASPYRIGKGSEREEVLRQRAVENGLPLLYLNMVGGQDELVFDGESLVMDSSGEVVQRAPAFTAGIYEAHFGCGAAGVVPRPGSVAPLLGEEESVYRALVLGVRDYVEKNGFPGVVIGLSGGIDSALTLAVAVDALGAERVEAVMMPSRYTREISLEDARRQARSMGVEYRVIPIEKAYRVFLEILAEEFPGREPDTTEENIQARCRGVILMAISNKSRRMVLTTGNKSEMAVGYATLYGDMAGGFDVLKDVPKTLVYRLARYRNSIGGVIPERVIERAPSAELAPDQRDSDTLPPYPVLDGILELYVEQDRCVEEIVAAGYQQETVERVVRMVDRNEYKRRQAPPGVRVTGRAFGRDRRYPITSGYGRGGGSAG